MKKKSKIIIIIVLSVILILLLYFLIFGLDRRENYQDDNGTCPLTGCDE